MKKVQVYITAKVVGTIMVPDETTDTQIANGIVDIYFHPANIPSIEKEDLGADEYSIKILPEDLVVDPNQLRLDI